MAEEAPRVSPLLAGLRCRCPGCGRGKLFAGYLTVAPRCNECDLDLGARDSGDGPAVFVVMLVGFVVVAAALIVELEFGPPVWLHMVLWTPTVLGLSLWLLRPFKAVLIALQFHHKAGE
ncbi:MAG TPA: DUF983 domain-containing protein [Alphaproteobacteria bacterium]|nr:DUF983 domain-containing protein [Alphaproteobacteria bacterium]MDP7427265.1 DUF983 domain-containing protein [Alphaproteobacteria bacterium]HJM49767.1 DUF983 domain-containing protein [Alphaproteobacteria bacterium]